MLKAKILFVGPCESGKTVLANFLTESSDITEYNPTQGVRILEFENPHVTSNTKGTGCEFELWDCGGDPKFESCWPALMKDSHGVVIVFNADLPSHLKEIEMWYSCFVQQQFLQDTQCLLIAHHKPGSGSDKGNLTLSPPLNKLKLVHSNLEDDPEEIRCKSGVPCIHSVVHPSPLPVSGTFLSSQTETLYPLNTNSPFPSPQLLAPPFSFLSL
ncbi:intraflagellar transport protein 22 homolog isoform X1 [Ursus americanus]|nr:intraflagellar transport protein 22 homolog isoform X1 [Ursus americanus]